ncbi:hypothetical protein LZC95_08415 [Pendulispora brunnea]|uniref:Uncharacterized protein n=1 Tax=Pendulispora brunnea TaxID=2905690 RepID=A0ABZ2KFM1_9BACT
MKVIQQRIVHGVVSSSHASLGCGDHRFVVLLATEKGGEGLFGEVLLLLRAMDSRYKFVEVNSHSATPRAAGSKLDDVHEARRGAFRHARRGQWTS